MLISIIPKGLRVDFQNLVTVCKFSKDEQNLNFIRKRFSEFYGIDKRKLSIVENPECTFFDSTRQKPKLTCNFFWKMGHKEAFYLAKDSNKRNKKCQNCGPLGHLASDCRKRKQKKKNCSLRKMIIHHRSECRKLKNSTSKNESANLLREMNSTCEKGFCFMEVVRTMF